MPLMTNGHKETVTPHVENLSTTPSDESVRIWHPLSCLSSGSTERIALIKLNTPFGNDTDVNLFKRLWKSAILTACADGGANAIYYHSAFPKEQFIPTLISGDFDSAQQEVLDHYRDHGTEIVETPDQDETDFTKCLRLVHDKISRSGNTDVVSKIMVHVSQEGRLDHIFANINTLYKSMKMGPTPVYLMHDQSVSCLLPAGKNMIDVDSPLRASWCSLVPIGQPADHVTISGLKYCIENRRLSMGELISTSNTFTDMDTDAVSVTTDQPLLWSMGVDLSNPSLFHPLANGHS